MAEAFGFAVPTGTVQQPEEGIETPLPSDRSTWVPAPDGVGMVRKSVLPGGSQARPLHLSPPSGTSNSSASPPSGQRSHRSQQIAARAAEISAQIAALSSGEASTPRVERVQSASYLSNGSTEPTRPIASVDDVIRASVRRAIDRAVADALGFKFELKLPAARATPRLA